LGDYELFLSEELPFREELYPPFKKIMRIMISHKYKNIASEILSNVRECLEKYKDIEIIGSGEAPIAKLSAKFRFHILLRSDSPKALLEAVAKCREKNCEIDIDPVNFS
jgi:primosomal protein N' (replication factor Y)